MTAQIKHLSALSLLAFFLLFAPPLRAESTLVATIDSLSGKVEIQRSGTQTFQSATLGTTMNAMDIIRTGRESRAGIIFANGVLLRIAPNTTLEVHGVGEKKKDEGALLSMGKAYLFSREDREIPTIRTPAVSAAIRGTEFAIEALPNKTIITVIDGAVDCKNEFGSVSLGKGEQAITEKGHAPTKALLARPHDAVQWAIYLPDVIEDTVQASTQGRELSETLLKLKNSLSSGDITEGAALIDAALNLTSKDTVVDPRRLRSSLYAQRSILALVTDHKNEALDFISQGEKEGPSPALSIAKAYLHQSNFDLEGAKREFQNALALTPNDPLSLVRLAELSLGSSDTKSARELLKKVLEISPKYPYAHTVLGFTALIEDKPEEAEREFKSAVKEDSTLSLPRLGLGLVKIRSGDLAGGRKEIERAVYLDPHVALYRSYLGKAFFEEEDEKRAAAEYDLAIDLDPNDPTPYLYRAYNHLSQNDPVRALKDVEQSVALNNHRAIYRSRLLLDQDQGVRSSSLAQVFNSLGFSELARVEAIKSLNHDYGNYSAHRLLSESYQSIILNDASVSESAISNLLSPLSFNLFQSPSGAASLNDYSALFDRSQTRTGIDVSYSKNDDVFTQGVYNAGKFDHFGYLVSADSNISGGSKSNAYGRFYRARGALQYQPNHAHRFLIDTNALYRKISDPLAVYNETKFEDGDLNIGYTGTISPASKVIVQATFGRRADNFTSDLTERNIFLDQIFEGESYVNELTALLNEFSRNKTKYSRTDAQFINDNEYLSLVVGGEAYFSDVKRTENSLILDDDAGLFEDTDIHFKSRGVNSLNALDGYFYSSIHLTPWADLNLGGNITRLDLEDLDIPPFGDTTRSDTKFSPKAGITLYPLSDTLVRFAYFETLRKSSLEDNLSIEPTLVAGINQRFTDLSGADSRNFGAGIDQKIWGSTYLGVEWLHRHVVESFKDVSSVITLNYDDHTIDSYGLPGDLFDDHQDREVAKAYLYQVLTEQVVATLDHEWSYLTHTDPGEVDYRRISLHKTKARLRYFSRSGFFVEALATRRDQDRIGSYLDSGNDTFTLVDARLGYRIPKRRGMIALQFSNIFKKSFVYDQTLGLEEAISPDFGVTVVGSVNF